MIRIFLLFFFLFSVCFIPAGPVPAEINVDTIVATVRQPFDSGLPPESARFAATVRAKREAIEKAAETIKNLSLLNQENVGQADGVALAAGVFETEILSQKNYTTEDSFGFEVSAGIKADTGNLDERVAGLLNNQNLLKKYQNYFKREGEKLARIRSLELENRLIPEGSEEADAIKQKFQTAISGLSAVSQYKKALDLVNYQRIPTRETPETVVNYLHTAINLDPEYAEAFLWLGEIFSAKGQYSRAVEYYQKALVIELKTQGEDHSDLAVAYNRLGLAFHRNGEYDRALEAYQKAWLVQIKTLGENHPDVATTYNNIGESYREKGDYDRAIEYYQKDLEITVKLLGRNHPNVATTYNNLAYAYYGKGEIGRALEYFQEALEIYRLTLGENHSQTKMIEKTIDFIKSEIG